MSRTIHNSLRKNTAFLIVSILSIGVTIDIIQVQSVNAIKSHDNAALIPSQSSSENNIIKPIPKATSNEGIIKPINLNTAEEHPNHVGKTKQSHKSNILDGFPITSNHGTGPLGFSQYSYESYLGNSAGYQSFNLPYTAVSPK